MTPSTSKQLLTTALDQFASSPLDSLQLQFVDESCHFRESRTVPPLLPRVSGSTSTSLFGPDGPASGTRSSSRRVFNERSTSTNSSRTSTIAENGSRNNDMLGLLSTVVASDRPTKERKNVAAFLQQRGNASTSRIAADARQAKASIADLSLSIPSFTSKSAKRSRASTARDVRPGEFLFPSLSLCRRLESLDDSEAAAHELADLLMIGTPEMTELLRRPVTTPLQPLLKGPSKCTRQTSKEQGMGTALQAHTSDKPYLSKSMHSLFCHLIDHRIETWIAMLKRAISFQCQDVDTMHKRVLSALQEVQESIQVEDRLDVKFHVSDSSSLDETTGAEKMYAAVEQELAQLAAEAITSMKTASSCTSNFLTSSPKTKKRSHDEIGDECANIPSLGCGSHRAEQHSKPDDSLQRNVVLSLTMEGTANVLAQIGPDLDQQQTVLFQTSGTVTGKFQSVSPKSSRKPSAKVDAPGDADLVLLGVGLDLETEQLIASMEKQARSVARSAAESVLLNAAAEEELESDDRPCSPESETEDNVQGDIKVWNPNTNTVDDLEYQKTPTHAYPVTPVKESGVTASMAPPHPRMPHQFMSKVSPTDTPFSPGRFFLNTHSPPLSPPSTPALVSPLERSVEYISSPSPRVKLQFKSGDNRQSERYPSRRKSKSKTSTGPYLPSLDESSGGNLVDVAGALTSLKHSSSSKLCA